MLCNSRCYLARIYLRLAAQLQVDFLILLRFERTYGSIDRGLSQISRWGFDHLKECIMLSNSRCYLAWIRLPLAAQLQVDFLLLIRVEGTDGSITGVLSPICRQGFDHLKECIMLSNSRCYLAWIRLPLAEQFQVDFLVHLCFERTDGGIARGLSQI